MNITHSSPAVGGVQMKSVGEHRLKGVSDPVALHQVLHEQLPAELALRTSRRAAIRTGPVRSACCWSTIRSWCAPGFA
ncbi:MAG: hypothetical protein ACR2H3_11355 [Acidimicrobiales bacterium]